MGWGGITRLGGRSAGGKIVLGRKSRTEYHQTPGTLQSKDLVRNGWEKGAGRPKIGQGSWEVAHRSRVPLRFHTRTHQGNGPQNGSSGHRRHVSAHMEMPGGHLGACTHVHSAGHQHTHPRREPHMPTIRYAVWVPGQECRCRQDGAGWAHTGAHTPCREWGSQKEVIDKVGGCQIP